MQWRHILLLIGLLIPSSTFAACLSTANLVGGGCVPYSGATTDVNLGTFFLTTSSGVISLADDLIVSGGANIHLTGGGAFEFPDTSMQIRGNALDLAITVAGGAEGKLDFSLLNSSYTFKFPDFEGKIAIIPTSLYDCPSIAIDEQGDLACNGDTTADALDRIATILASFLTLLTTLLGFLFVYLIVWKRH